MQVNNKTAQSPARWLSHAWAFLTQPNPRGNRWGAALGTLVILAAGLITYALTSSY